MFRTSKGPTPRCFYIVSLLLFISSLYITLSFGGLLPSIFETSTKIYEETYPDAKALDFLVIGDWGNAGKGRDFKHGSQANVSKAMEFIANQHDSKFIVNVGDNFYKRSTKDHQGILSVNDSKWEEIWLNVYNSTKLRKLPWYTVAGNHDWYTNVTAQIEYSLTINSRFFFPSLFYVRSSLFGKEMKTKAVWVHIDTNVFYYNVDTIEAKMEGLRTNLLNFGLHTQQAIEDKLKWIEQRLIENQDADYIFVIGHHPLIGICSQVSNLPRLLELLERYRVSAYFAGHNHVLEYKAPTKFSPVAFFISGAGCKTGYGCEGKDWGMPRGTFGFVHANIKEETMDFEFIDATKLNKQSAGEIVYNGTINSRSNWYPKI
ncbi:uncharacterized protein OCT59_021805 [Rhizophagus irregularis]|uniref:Metallo-dependent phosphatase-like protein n=2 Tax=Rhizophagus irregularis TaxID=588596 RepID=U9UT09_RHIID|nr:Metallo-dependent phosphatase-like protein [Rhizophagus irregularis DAOM 181602=DAOM 197198]EXX71026.1 hypothetical protein RirG_082130 [Rhizophagus irregularis DAOM 197198w]UZO28271.1 hypothetical protein OCT59_021805 [Rhizophagus irregularis]POG59267.1 Metallo-dependent phosphatase-like protein [Rhizophagus irregularis DAOM 181602=DAOM 197198]CAG8649804.1 2251_t:CDS:2 [Rhizophagus irregularis]GBC30341.1 acid phosphatase [Rhizophagus irregularis DAOM 181602=DAOM 197198]|eukprot:XP_025166133.1 Metallo-dependent phosphatase-like protein [Rhizophagus irregularis DAOM 181602=DAOM 197198]